MAVSYTVIFLAALASFIFGAIYYGALGKLWLNALGKTQDDIEREGKSLPVSLAVSFVSQLLMAWIFAGLLLHLSKSGVPATLRNGALSGAFCWAGFILPALATNHRFQGASPKLTAVDSSHWLGVLVIQGAILGAWAIR
jgi:4-hydroxybenzoate polyprenyltransferase